MAVVSIPEKKMTLTEDSRIAEYLNGIGIEYERWNVIDPEDAAGDEAILHVYAEKIREVQARGGYTSVDVINIHPQTDGLKEMLARFNREHWHDEDEVRFRTWARIVSYSSARRTGCRHRSWPGRYDSRATRHTPLVRSVRRPGNHNNPFFPEPYRMDPALYEHRSGTALRTCVFRAGILPSSGPLIAWI